MTLRARLGTAIDLAVLRHRWSEEQERKFSPKVDLSLRDRELTATAMGRWDDDNLKQALQAAIHRIDSKCSIEWH